MRALKVANQEGNVGKKAEPTTREDDDHRTLSDIDRWLYSFSAEDDYLHRDNSLTPPSSSLSISREKEMSAIVSALTHVVAGNVPTRQYGGEGTSNSSSSSGQKRRRELEEGGGGGKDVKAANTLTVDQYFAGGSSSSRGIFSVFLIITHAWTISLSLNYLTCMYVYIKEWWILKTQKLSFLQFCQNFK